MLFSELPQQVREYLNDRFVLHGIAGEDAFNTSSIFPDEIKEMSPGDIVRFMEKKHISHIYPKSKFPERESDLNNIILEDAAPNMERGAQIMTQDEHEAAKLDLQNDIIDGDIESNPSISKLIINETLPENCLELHIPVDSYFDYKFNLL